METAPEDNKGARNVSSSQSGLPGAGLDHNKTPNYSHFLPRDATMQARPMTSWGVCPSVSVRPSSTRS